MYMCLCICVHAYVYVESHLWVSTLLTFFLFYLCLKGFLCCTAWSCSVRCTHIVLYFLNVFSHICLQGPRCIGGSRAGSLGVRKTCTEGYVILGKEIPICWQRVCIGKGKNAFLPSRSCPSPFPNKTKFSGHVPTHTKKIHPLQKGQSSWNRGVTPWVLWKQLRKWNWSC